MIEIGRLDPHPSSPTAAYGDPSALAKRDDLYTGDDFYFGFASSNQTFLDIIGEHQPLAIKHGPIFSIYRHDVVEGYTCHTYYIDAKARELLPLISLTAKPTAAGAFEQVLPWSFADLYMPRAEPDLAIPREGGLSHEEKIGLVLEQLAKNAWPEDEILEQLPEAVAKLVSGREDLAIALGDLSAYKRRMDVASKEPTADDFVAAYNPFYDNQKVKIDFLLKKNISRITVRQVNGDYPRIEVIIPNVPEATYSAVFKRDETELYSTLQAALADPALISGLIREHFPEKVELYFAELARTLPSASASASAPAAAGGAGSGAVP